MRGSVFKINVPRACDMHNLLSIPPLHLIFIRCLLNFEGMTIKIPAPPFPPNTLVGMTLCSPAPNLIHKYVCRLQHTVSLIVNKSPGSIFSMRHNLDLINGVDDELLIFVNIVFKK